MLRGPKPWKELRWYQVRWYNWYRAASPRGSCSRFHGSGGERYDKEGVTLAEVGEEEEEKEEEEEE